MGLALWELLLSTLHDDDEATLTCDECFAVLMYLAERASEGANPDNLRRAAQRHLARCPDCREKHLHQLHVLGVEWARRSGVE